MDLIKKVGISALTITVNAVDPAVGEKIYSFVNYNGKVLHGREAFEVLSRNQLQGLKEAAKAGIAVKVNVVYIPGVNSEHIPQIAKTVRGLGAYIMNIMPLIPQGKFAGIAAPSQDEVRRMRHSLEGTLIQFHKCTQCRADASGVPGEECCGGKSPFFKIGQNKKEEA
jgi:hypothetical protein